MSVVPVRDATNLTGHLNEDPNWLATYLPSSYLLMPFCGSGPKKFFKASGCQALKHPGAFHRCCVFYIDFSVQIRVDLRFNCKYRQLKKVLHKIRRLLRNRKVTQPQRSRIPFKIASWIVGMICKLNRRASVVCKSPFQKTPLHLA
jgi:hypothetical protein